MISRPHLSWLPWGAVLVFTALLPADVNAQPQKQPQPALEDGAAISPEFAKSFFDRLIQLHEADGCTMVDLNTGGLRMTVTLQTGGGAERAIEVATAPGGGWAVAAPGDVEGDCGATVNSIKRVLAELGAPPPVASYGGSDGPLSGIYGLLAVSFVLLLVGTAWILIREIVSAPSPLYPVLALGAIWGVALALRLWLSPWTFLHEYYHIAETVSGYLIGDSPPAYGNTGPAIFRLVAWACGRPQDVDVIFATNAVLSSLAIPAVALLDFGITRSWTRALCAAVLLCVLPQHLRFSAGEDLFVQAVTLGMWALALSLLYLRTQRLGDALLAALALSLAVQTRPEMLFFPAVLGALVVLVESQRWRVVLSWRTAVALAVLALLLTPRVFELRQVFQEASAPVAVLPSVGRYLRTLVLFDHVVTPPLYWLVLLVGVGWSVVHEPRLAAWVTLVFVGYTLFALSLFGNPIFCLRAQVLPTSFTVLLAAGVAPVWMKLWHGRPKVAPAAGAVALAIFALIVVAEARGFITERRDQQLEWTFLERTTARLPQRGTLLTAVEVGGFNLDAFPQFLLVRDGKRMTPIDIQQVHAGKVPWPQPGDSSLYYQGMFCYFADFAEPPPEPMTAACQAVHDHYVLEPLFTEDLTTPGYSYLRYSGDGQRPFHIGFFRLKARR